MTAAKLQRTSMSYREVSGRRCRTERSAAARRYSASWRTAGAGRAVTPVKYGGERSISAGNSKRLMRLLDTMEEFGAILVGGEVSDHSEGDALSQVDSLEDLVNNHLQTLIAEALIAWAVDVETRDIEAVVS